MEPFVFHKQENVLEIAEILKQFDSEWSNYTFRQNNYFVHRHTSTILITEFDAISWESETYKQNSVLGFDYKPVLNNKKLLDLVVPIFDYLRIIHDGEIAKSMFVKLRAGKNIDEHSDAGLYLSMAKRHHIPIITNDEIWFYVDGLKKNLRQGEIWQIDNSKLHKVENPSNQDRVHLIVDVIPKYYVGETPIIC